MSIEKHSSRQGNYFFASLAAKEIKKMDENCSDLIDEFIEFKIETRGDVDFEEDYIKCFNRIAVIIAVAPLVHNHGNKEVASGGTISIV
jgi:hypothetical protein